MRIVHLTTVHHALDPRIFHKQLKTLREAGYEAHLVAPRSHAGTVDGIPVHALPQVNGRYQRVRIQRDAFRQARRLSADCYHIHDPELIPLAYALKQVTGARIIYDMHEDYRWHGPAEGRLIRMVERWGFRWVDRIVIANAHHRDITETAAAPTTRIANHFKPIGATPPRATCASLSENEPLRLVYTGVMSDRGGRGLSQLIRLAEVIQKNRFEGILDLVGVCYIASTRRRVEVRIRHGALDGTVQRTGWNCYVPWEDMVPHLSRAHVGLMLGTDHPNQVQKIPTKFYEYLHFGLPILCSDFPRWRRFIERHGCGAVVPPGDVEAAFAVLRQWRDDPDRYRALSEAAQAAAAQYHWNAMGKRLVRLYDELLGVRAVAG